MITFKCLRNPFKIHSPCMININFGVRICPVSYLFAKYLLSLIFSTSFINSVSICCLEIYLDFRPIIWIEFDELSSLRLSLFGIQVQIHFRCVDTVSIVFVVKFNHITCSFIGEVNFQIELKMSFTDRL